MPVSVNVAVAEKGAVPFAGGIEERHEIGGRLLRGNHQRVEPGQPAIDIAVAVAGAGPARADAAQDGAGVAGDELAFGRTFGGHVTRSSA